MPEHEYHGKECGCFFVVTATIEDKEFDIFCEQCAGKDCLAIINK